MVDARQRAAGAFVAERVPPEEWGRIADWDDVVAESAAPTIFLTRDWVSAWWDNFGAEFDPCLLRVTGPDGRCFGIAPLYVERLRVRANRLGLMGDRVVGSEYLGLIARRGAERDVALAVADWLAAAGPHWHVAELSGIREGDPATTELEQALRAAAARVDEEEHPCSAIALPGDFAEYLASLGSKFRQGYRQRTNKLLRTCDVRFLRTGSEAELPLHLDTLFRHHQARWTEAGRLGVFADEQMRGFYGDVALRLLRSDSLRFWHLEADGEIRASQFAFSYDGVLHSLQESYDSEFAPPGVGGLGVVLRGKVLESAIEEGIRTYDFLGGDEDHKLRWGASVHTVRHLTLTRRGAAARGAWLATAGADSTRKAIMSVLPERVLERLRAGRAAHQRRRRGMGPS